ncbi:MAG: hypothetical protein AAFU67_09335, partial [Bacteroidota bacterium]
TPNQLSSENYLLNSGDRVELFFEEFLEDDLLPELRLRGPELTIARQFANGFRIGAGLEYFYEQFSNFKQLDEVEEELNANQFVHLNKIAFEHLYSSLSAQYTIRRNKRLRFFAGARLLGSVYTSREDVEVLFGGTSADFHFQRKTGWLNRRFWHTLEVDLQLGFQYQLGQRFSVGYQILPRNGVEGRFLF